MFIKEHVIAVDNPHDVFKTMYKVSSKPLPSRDELSLLHVNDGAHSFLMEQGLLPQKIICENTSVHQQAMPMEVRSIKGKKYFCCSHVKCKKQASIRSNSWLSNKQLQFHKGKSFRSILMS